MTIGKKRLVNIAVHIEAITNMDAFTLERRLETFIDPNRMRSECLEAREFIRFTNTRMAVHAAGAPEVTLQPTTGPVMKEDNGSEEAKVEEREDAGTKGL